MFQKHPQHDELFLKVFSQIELTKSFVQGVLPDTILTKLDLDTLLLPSVKFVSQKLDVSNADLTVECQFKSNGEISKIYILLEHKSYFDLQVPFQLFRYMHEIWMKAPKGQKGQFRRIYPILFYSSPDK